MLTPVHGWRWREDETGCWRLAAHDDDTAPAPVRWLRLDPESWSATFAGRCVALWWTPAGFRAEITGDGARLKVEIGDAVDLCRPALAAARLLCESMVLGVDLDRAIFGPFRWLKRGAGFELHDVVGRAVASTVYVPDDGLSAPGRWVAGSAGVLDDQAVTVVDRVPDCAETRLAAQDRAERLAGLR